MHHFLSLLDILAPLWARMMRKARSEKLRLRVGSFSTSRSDRLAHSICHNQRSPSMPISAPPAKRAKLTATTKHTHSVKKRPQLTLITTDHWLKSWFEKLILPTSRFHSADIEYVSIATGTVESHIEAVCAAIQRRPQAACFACTDCAMEVYSAAVEVLKTREKQATTNADEKRAKQASPRGSSFLCYFLATNKLACRRLVRGCDDLKCKPVMAGDAFLPDLGTSVDAFFKPLAECGNESSRRFNSSDASGVLTEWFGHV
jgi:hypothetical protein